MKSDAKPVGLLSPADCAKHSVWKYAAAPDDRGIYVRPARVPAVSLKGKLVATRVLLANGQQVWELIGNIDLSNPRVTRHVLTISIERGGQWFHLARYHDPDYAERGPPQLARFLGLDVESVFPITYDVSSSIRGRKAAAAGQVLAEPDERLTRAEIIALSVP